MAQQCPADGAYGERNGEGDGESPVVMLQSVDNIHTIQRGNEGARLHDDGHGGEGTHRVVGVVVDDARVGVHRRLQDV